MAMAIPVIDLGQADERVAAEIDAACRTMGFFYVTGHGLQADQVARLFGLASELFSDDTRRECAIDESNYGYSGLRVENLDPKTCKEGDYKEAYNFGRFVHGKASQKLPKTCRENSSELAGFAASCHTLSLRILSAFATALGLGRDRFRDAHDYDKSSGDILRLLHYPPVPPEAMKDSNEARAAAHSDYGSLTLLFQHEIGGLQVKTIDQEWIDAPVIEDAVLVNVGDAMEFWTSGTYKSTLHRVMPNKTNTLRSRYSIAYFKHANDNVVLEPLLGSEGLDEAQRAKLGGDTSALTAGEHLKRRLAATYGFQQNEHEVNREKRSMNDVLMSPAGGVKRTRSGKQTPPESSAKSRRRRALPASHSDPESAFQSVDMQRFAKHDLGLQDAECFYDAGFMSRQESMRWYRAFLALDSWYQPTLKMYGREFLQSRQIAAYATDPSLSLKYSGQKVDMLTEYPDCLSEVQARLEAHLGVRFNHVMLNRYDSGEVHIGSHADNLENKVIASLSLGAERTFVLRHCTLAAEQGGVRKLRLASGSLLVMQGPMQQYWKHEIPKERRQKDGRISLTFRQLLY